ncbi:MAG: hypothetical protein ACHQEM_10195 [Chitinophagales bacterium]
MRNGVWELVIVVLAIVCIHLVSSLPSGFIKGKIYPVNKAEDVIAFRGTDSVKTKSKNGVFEMKLSPGNWTVIVSDKAQIRNLVMENLTVNQGQQINLGEIRLAD